MTPQKRLIIMMAVSLPLTIIGILNLVSHKKPTITNEHELLARLDYGSIDAHGLSREWMVNGLEGCVKGCMASLSQQLCEDRCICYMNKWPQIMTKDEFISMSSAIDTHSPMDPILKKKMDSMVSECNM